MFPTYIHAERSGFYCAPADFVEELKNCPKCHDTQLNTVRIPMDDGHHHYKFSVSCQCRVGRVAGSRIDAIHKWESYRRSARSKIIGRTN